MDHNIETVSTASCLFKGIISTAELNTLNTRTAFRALTVLLTEDNDITVGI